MKPTATRNKLKPDIVLKDFWRNNARFADLFNGCLFHGNKVLDPDMLLESDTDVSSILKFNGYAETLGHILDVVKKSVYGIDFVILGLENQMNVHYAMPLRHLAGDTLIYMKEYSDTVKNKKRPNCCIPILNSFPACAGKTACMLLFPYAYTMVKLPGMGRVLYWICLICSMFRTR